MNKQQWHYIIKTIDDNEIINDTLETDLKASEICRGFEMNNFEVLVLEKVIQIPRLNFKISDWLSYKKESNYV